MSENGDRLRPSGGRKWLVPSLMLAGGAGVTFAVLEGILSLPGIPYNVRAMFPPAYRTVAMAAFSVTVVWLGFAPGAVARMIQGRPSGVFACPLAAAIVALVTWFCLRFSVTSKVLLDLVGSATLGIGKEWEYIGRFLALGGGAMLLLIVGGVAVGAVAERGWRSGWRLEAKAIAVAVPFLVVARIVVINYASTDNLTELLRTRPWPGDVFMMVLFLLLGANAAALAHARGKRLVLAAAATAALVLPGWALLGLALEPEVHKYGLVFPAARFLLGPDRGTAISMWELFARWAAVQLGAVAVLAYGWRAARLALGGAEAPGGGSPAAGTGGLASAAPAGGVVRYGRVHLWLMLGYLVFVIYGSLVPLGYAPVPLEEAIRRFGHIPYFHIAVSSRADLVANFLLFIPLTFLAIGGFTREGRRRGAAPIAVATAFAAIALSAAIEFTQIYFPQRTVSLNDILAESIGGLAGVVVWFAFGRRVSDWARSLWRRKARDRLAASVLSGYVVFLVLYQMLPFDMTIRPVELYHKLRSPRVVLVPFAHETAADPYYLVSTVALMVPVGYLLALLRPSRRRGWWAAVTLQAGAFASLIELAQLFVYSRYSSTTDVILGAFGGLAGAMAADLFGPAARRRPLESPQWQKHGRTVKFVLLVAWTLGLMVEKWWPFHFVWPAQGLAHAAWEFVGVPLQKQHGLSEGNAASQVAREVVLLLVLGMLLRVLWPRGSRGGRLAAGVIASAMAVVLEFCQILTPLRTADLAGACFGAAGGILGVAMAWRFVDVFLAAGRGPAPPTGPCRPGSSAPTGPC